MLPIVLYSHPYGPNPWKVAIILEELGIPYETRFVDFADVKKEPYIKLNPNGRLPSIEDPNNGIKLFESGAIVESISLTNTTLTTKFNSTISIASMRQRHGCIFRCLVKVLTMVRQVGS